MYKGKLNLVPRVSHLPVPLERERGRKIRDAGNKAGGSFHITRLGVLFVHVPCKGLRSSFGTSWGGGFTAGALAVSFSVLSQQNMTGDI